MTMTARWPLRNFTWNYYLSCLLALLLVLAAVWVMATGSFEVMELPPRNYNSYVCETENTNSREAFRVLDVFHINDAQLADRFCKDSVIAARYGSVELMWQYRNRIDLRSINDQSYALLFARDSLLQRANVRSQGSYQPILSFEEQSSYLVSMTSKPVLDAAYFTGKKIGLQEDTNSQTGYRIPRQALQQAGIDDGVYSILYFKSHRDMIRALQNNDVDIIATSGPAIDAWGFESLLLQNKVPPPQVFLHPDLMETSVQCAVQRVLGSHLSSGPLSDYTSLSKILLPCEEEGVTGG